MTNLAEITAIPDWEMTEYEHRHPSTKHVLTLFDYNHLPPDLKLVSEPCWRLAVHMCDRLEDGPELTVALRKLKEAKDGFVCQAVLDRQKD